MNEIIFFHEKVVYVNSLSAQTDHDCLNNFVINTPNLIFSRVVVDDAVLLQNRNIRLICSILISKHSAHSKCENEYPHFMFLSTNC